MDLISTLRIKTNPIVFVQAPFDKQCHRGLHRHPQISTYNLTLIPNHNLTLQTLTYDYTLTLSGDCVTEYALTIGHWGFDE